VTASHEEAFVIAANKTQERIRRLSAACLALPGATRTDQGDHASFRVAGRVFAYLLNNHHGDGILGVCCKVLPGDNLRLIETNPDKFYVPAYIGPRGWVGLRLDLRTVDWAEARDLLHGSHLLAAPKKAPRRRSS
jgi:predicted DNA-binding protein (MmcQ/YjbR family)